MNRKLLAIGILFFLTGWAHGVAIYRATGRATSIQTTIPQAFLPAGVIEGAEFSLEYAVDETVPLNVGFTTTQVFAGFVGPSIAFDGFGGTINVFPQSQFHPNGLFLFDIDGVTPPPSVTGIAADVLSISQLDVTLEDDFFAVNNGSTDSFPVQVPDVTTERSSWLFRAEVQSNGFAEELTISGVVDSLVLIGAPDVSDPVDPTDPMDPVAPMNPIDPMDPVDPVIPPMDPVDPMNPNGGNGGGMPGQDGGMPTVGDPTGTPTGDAGGDSGVVPEPSSIGIWLLLIASLVGYRKAQQG